jgi:hypothetical protein
MILLLSVQAIFLWRLYNFILLLITVLVFPAVKCFYNRISEDGDIVNVSKKMKYFGPAQSSQPVGYISYNQVTILSCGWTLVEGNFHIHVSTVRLHVGNSTRLSSFYK